jgi:2-polyprenyl-3-methyl-5-hydroxy-6-metoxy-1,4-benzoquinol methylase
LKLSRDRPSSTFEVSGFAEFSERAGDPGLSQYAKIGFPDEYRAGKAKTIIADIAGKLSNLRKTQQSVLDVGAGCSDLPEQMVSYCDSRDHRVVLVDSAEMLQQLPQWPHVTKIEGQFPGCIEAVCAASSSYDAILVYSVIQYVFSEGNIWSFVDTLANLLAPGGQLLIGDVPNTSTRKRFLSSAAGRAYHEKHFSSSIFPEVRFNQLEPGLIDDAVVLGIVARLRAAGFDAFVVPQASDLPMSNRREDILVRRP